MRLVQELGGIGDLTSYIVCTFIYWPPLTPAKRNEKFQKILQYIPEWSALPVYAVRLRTQSRVTDSRVIAGSSPIRPCDVNHFSSVYCSHIGCTQTKHDASLKPSLFCNGSDAIPYDIHLRPSVRIRSTGMYTYRTVYYLNHNGIQVVMPSCSAAPLGDYYEAFLTDSASRLTIEVLIHTNDPITIGLMKSLAVTRSTVKRLGWQAGTLPVWC